MKEKLLTITEAAKILGVSLDTLRQLGQKRETGRYQKRRRNPSLLS